MTTPTSEQTPSTLLGADTAAAGNDTSAAGNDASNDSIAGADSIAGDKAPEVPEKYEFKFADGVKVDEARLAKFSETAKGLKLSQEQAQSLADIYAEAVAEGQASQQKAWTEMVDGWAEQARTDKEFGGANFEANVGLAKKVIDKYGTPELRETLNQTGLGNHPDLIRLLVKVGKDISEDTIKPGTPASAEKTLAQRLYPSMA